MSLVVMVATGCGQAPAQSLAVVNGQPITQRDLEARMAKLTPAYRQALGGDQRRLLEEMVLETLLIQEARKRGVDRDPQVQELLQEAKRQIMIGRLLEREGREKVQVSDQEIAQFYEQHKQQFAQPERWRASHILVNTEAEARAVVERLGKGESFEVLAKALSQDPSKQRGGDIGYFSRGQLIPEFEEAAGQLKVGQTSGVVKTPLGYHVIRLVDHQPVQQRGLAEVKDQIVQQLKGQQERARVDRFLGQLRTSAHVFIRDDALPPAAGQRAVPALDSAPGAGQRAVPALDSAPGAGQRAVAAPPLAPAAAPAAPEGGAAAPARVDSPSEAAPAPAETPAGS